MKCQSRRHACSKAETCSLAWPWPWPWSSDQTALCQPRGGTEHPGDVCLWRPWLMAAMGSGPVARLWWAGVLPWLLD